MEVPIAIAVYVALVGVEVEVKIECSNPRTVLFSILKRALSNIEKIDTCSGEDTIIGRNVIYTNRE